MKDSQYMNPLLRTLAILFGLLLLAASVQAAEAGNPVTIRDAYVRGLPPGVRNTAAYMTIINNGDTDLVLSGASSPAADSTMLHTTVNTNGKMSMEHVMSAVVPAHGRLVLSSGGYHFMLMGLRRQLGSGDTVKLTLQFRDAFTVPLELPVVSVLDEQ